MIRQLSGGVSALDINAGKNPMRFTQPSIAAPYNHLGEPQILKRLGAIIRADLEPALSEPLPEGFLALLLEIETAEAGQIASEAC